MDEAMKQVAVEAEKAACIRPEDYKDRDGLWVCGICHTRKQTVIEVPGVIPRTVVFCDCKHRQAEWKKFRWKGKQAEERDQLQAEGLSDMDTDAAKRMTLEDDDGSNPKARKVAETYIAGWDRNSAGGKYGMILWGQPGTGKTFYATAIGNALRKKGVTVARATAPAIVEASQGLYDTEKKRLFAMLNRNDLLILDDLGAERDTGFAREVIFNLIDTRIKLNRNLLVTTNLPIGYMSNPTDRTGNADMNYKRIFDRIFGSCAPVLIDGTSHRMGEGRDASRWVQEGVFQNRT